MKKGVQGRKVKYADTDNKSYPQPDSQIPLLSSLPVFLLLAFLWLSVKNIFLLILYKVSQFCPYKTEDMFITGWPLISVFHSLFPSNTFLVFFEIFFLWRGWCYTEWCVFNLSIKPTTLGVLFFLSGCTYKYHFFSLPEFHFLYAQ